MILTVVTSALLTLWILFCAGTYVYHYIIEVVLDLPVTGENPCTAHAALKKLIQRLLHEALELPSLRKTGEHPAGPADESNRTYEDLLATAILNKVITNCQQNLPTSSANSVSSRVSTSSRNRDDGKEYFFGEETLDSKWKTTDLDSTSVSSLEEWIQSDSSLGSTKYVDRVSLTIQHRIEEVTPTDSDLDEDDEEDEKDEEDGRERGEGGGDAEYFRKAALDEDPNWFLQRRRLRGGGGGGRSPVPVPMLVPDPAPEARVLIGDREAGETSDLSDAGSEYGDADGDDDSALGKASTDGDLSADSGVRVGSRGCDDTGRSERSTPPKADKTVDDDNVEDASILSTYSNTEKDTEYTERYASLPRTILKSPTLSSSERCVKEPLIQNVDEEKEIILNGHHEKSEVDPEYENVEFTGAYSKKEKEKWKHAIDMKNNPYSKENIEKRLKSRSSVSSMFGSDYYARLASNPSGGKARESRDDQEVFTLLSDSKLSENSNVELPKPEDDSEKYSAVLAKVVNDEELSENGQIEPIFKVEQKLTIAETSDVDTIISELTSDSDMSYIHCYNVENAQVSKKPPEEVSKPNGLLYRQTEDSDIILDIITRQLIDENHNSKFTDDKGEYEINILNSDVVKQKDNTKPVKSESKVSIVEMKLKNGTSTPTVPSPSDGQEHKPSSDEKIKANECNIVSSIEIITTDTIDASNANDVVTKHSEQVNFKDMPVGEQSTPRYQKVTVTKEIKLPHRSTVARKIDVSLAENRTAKLNQGELKETISSVPTTNKKSDNTLIKKIYSDPAVQTFVRQSRENLPVLFDDQKTFVHSDSSRSDERYACMSSPEPGGGGRSAHKWAAFPGRLQRSMSQSLVRDSHSFAQNRGMKRSVSLAPTDDSDSASDYQAFSLGSYASDRAEKEASRCPQGQVVVVAADPEIAELKEKQLVKSRLGEISKSFPNVSKISGVRLAKHGSAGQSASASSETLNGSLRNEEVPISVKDLKKRFEHADVSTRKDRLIYSLTARSLSKQVREDLKNQNLDEPLSIEVVKCQTETPTPEPMSEVIKEPILDTESKIKFYEKLNE